MLRKLALLVAVTTPSQACWPHVHSPRVAIIRCCASPSIAVDTATAPATIVQASPPFALPPRLRGGVAGGVASAAVFTTQHVVGIGAVPAASIVGLSFGAALPTAAWRLPMFCGAFVGMSAQAVLSSPTIAMAVGALAGGIGLPFLDARERGALKGCGGRLGFVAMLSTAWAWALLHLVGFVTGAQSSSSIRLLSLPSAPPSWAAALLGPLVGALATKLWIDVLPKLGVRSSRFVAERLGNSVSASSAVSLLACSVGLPAAWHAPIFTGTFVAMSAMPAVLQSYAHLASAAFAASAAALALGGSIPFGGRLGVSAVLGVLAATRVNGIVKHM